MTRCVAFLRGINVGGHRLIPMETLQQLFASMGFDNVKTYIQSGNVIFGTGENVDHFLEQRIEKALQQALGYEVPVLLRTVAAVEEIVRHNPFEAELTAEKAKLYVAFLAKEPAKQAREALLVFNGEQEKYHCRDHEVYCLLYKDVNNPRQRFALDTIEKILKVSVTVRNWATANKVLKL